MESQTRKRLGSFLLAGLSILAGPLLLIRGSTVIYGEGLNSADQTMRGMSTVNEANLEEGDVLLRCGEGFVSSLIAEFSGCGVSHCGVVVRDGEGWQVIHSISGRISDRDGIRANSVEEFVSQARPGSIYHLKPRLEVNRGAIVRRCYYHLKLQAAFDHDFNLQEDNRLYCSELVRSAYLHGGMPDLFSYRSLAGKKILDMKSFFDPQLFVRQPPDQPPPGATH